MSEESSDNPLEQSIRDELSAYDDVADKVRSIASLIPWLDEKREEAEVKLYTVENAPKDFLSEVGPQLLISQRRDTERARLLGQNGETRSSLQGRD